MIKGNVNGVRNRILDELDEIYNIKTLKYELCNEEILNIIKKASEECNREISVAINRKGIVHEVTIGDSSTVSLPIIDIAMKKLSGYRIIHTHPNKISRLSGLDISALLKMKLDCIAAISVNTDDPKISMAFCGVRDGVLQAELLEEMSISSALNFNVEAKIKENEKLIQNTQVNESSEETAILIGIESEDSLKELEELAYSADMKVSQLVLQKKSRPDNGYYFGSGKMQELSQLAQLTNSNVIIADDELTGSQIKNMEDITGVKVIDRTILILEIFSKRAKSRESRLQIELAQLKYRMTRLMGMGSIMSRTGGGIGTRGPGETKLETDRRKIRERYHDLSESLKTIVKNRSVQRENRNRQEIPGVALVGYTNTGKSTLRNLISKKYSKEDIKKEDVFAKNMLFATLDTTTRAIELKDKRIITLTDTVGFIRKLPHELVEAFKSTLEEVIYADILIHVVDASSEDSYEQYEAVLNVLAELGAINKPMIIALNKTDLGISSSTNEIIEKIADKHPIIKISAKDEINIESLLDEILNLLPDNYKKYSFLIPYSDAKTVNLIHESGNVLKEEYREEGTYIEAQVPDSIMNKLKSYILGE